jgi:putative hemolysin
MSKKRDEDRVEEEILSMVEEGHEQGFIQEDEAEMISNILDLDDKVARDIMTSRSKLFAVDGEKTVGDVLEECLESGYSRYPVFEDDMDHMVGVLYLKDLVNSYLKNPEESVSNVADTAMFIHPTYDITKLLKKMQREKSHLAIVLDEYGQTDGIVTLEDIIEEIVGNIYYEHDNEETEIQHTYDDGYVVDGLISLNDLKEIIDDIEFPEEDIETLNGFMLYKFGRFPKAGENILIEYEGYIFEAVSIEDNLITKVRITAAQNAGINKENTEDI